SKWYLVLGTLEADQLAMLFVLLISSILNAAYFMPIVYRAFFCAPEDALFKNRVVEAPIWCLVPLVLTAICSIILLFYPQPFLALAEMTVETIFQGPK
ncbi:monovalent cation/H+ antiporter subunit D family protein, partial [bacterium]|nr:monovalent cation/H+ antiporter subunit D family protein [bacterium]